MNRVNIDWLTLILHMVDLYQSKTINTLIVSALRSQQVQVELEDSINITYGILDNIFQILDTDNVPVTQIIPCPAILLKKKMEVLSPTLSKSQKLSVPGPKVKKFFQIL